MIWEAARRLSEQKLPEFLPQTVECLVQFLQSKIRVLLFEHQRGANLEYVAVLADL
jgi:hypothetical protein